MRKNSWEKCSFGQDMQKEMGFCSLCAQGNQEHGIMPPFTSHLQEDSCDVKAGSGWLKGNSTALSTSPHQKKKMSIGKTCQAGMLWSSQACRRGWGMYVEL